MDNITQFSEKFQAILNDIHHQQEDVQKDILLVQSEAIGDLQTNLRAMTLSEDNHHQSLVALLEDLRMPICRMKSTVQDVQDGLHSKLRQEILDWVSTVPHRLHHDRIYSDVLPGTGQWFLDDQRLLAWRSASSPSLLWLHGIPGSGKSKLT